METFRDDSPDSAPLLTDLFQLRDTIGEGGFGKVKEAKHKLTLQKVAVKIIEKERFQKSNDMHRVALEIDAMKRLGDHPNIIRLYQHFETSDRFYIVMEYMGRGELFDYVLSKTRLQEQEARLFFRQLVSAVSYMHAQGFVHRDLKPENLLLVSGQKVKLIDFGLVSYRPDPMKSLLSTSCGSPAYSAPEIFTFEKYTGPQVDVWSMGVLLYAMLCGYLPFDEEDLVALCQQVLNGSFEIPSFLTEQSAELIKSMLQTNPTNRITTNELRRHPWVIADSGLEVIDLFVAPAVRDLDEDVVDEMARNFDMSVENMTTKILESKFDDVSLLYEMMELSYKNGHRIKLSPQSPLKAMTEFYLDHPSSPTSIRSVSPLATMQSQTAQLFGRKGRARAETAFVRPTSMPTSMLRKDGSASIDSALPMEAKTERHALFGRSPKERRERIASESNDSSPTSSLRGSLHHLTSGLRRIFSGSPMGTEPRQVTGNFDVNTSSSKDPVTVMGDLVTALSQKQGMKIIQDRFRMTARHIDPYSKKEIVMRIEVGIISKTETTGIIINRVKGDTWQYQRLRLEILRSVRL